jgi:hypothetical protein
MVVVLAVETEFTAPRSYLVRIRDVKPIIASAEIFDQAMIKRAVPGCRGPELRSRAGLPIVVHLKREVMAEPVQLITMRGSICTSAICECSHLMQLAQHNRQIVLRRLFRSVSTIGVFTVCECRIRAP